MLFSKNKIKKSIKEIDTENDSQIDSEFETLSSIKRRQKDKKLVNKLFINPYHDGIANIQEKKQKTSQYFKTNYKTIIFWLFIFSFISLFVMLCYTAFSPFEAKIIGDQQTSLSNFYMAYGSSISGLTPIGYSIVVVFLLMLILGFFVFKWNKEKLIFKINKVTKILSITCYLIIGLLIVGLLLLVLIPPSIYLQSNLQLVTSYRAEIASAATDSEKLSLISKLNSLIINNKLPMKPISSSGSPTIAQYEAWIVDAGYAIPQSLISATFLYNANSFINPSLTVQGIIIVVFFTILAAASMILIPIGLLIFVTVKKIKFDEVNEDIIRNYNFFKRLIYKFAYSVNDFSLRNMKKVKDKESFHKYKKRLDKTGQKANIEETFTTSATREQLVLSQENKIREEIMKNAPNVTFLSSNGKWMYHDGNNNIFIARGDEWIPFDISKEIHKAHANIVDENLNFSPSEKKVKESKLSSFSRKKESEITIPDQEIDDIVKSLDI